MAASRTLKRLLRVRELEEEQRRVALETAQNELNRLKMAIDSAVDRQRRGRRLIESSVLNGEQTDRFAGVEEIRTGERIAAFLQPHLATHQALVEQRREEYMAKRIERRQAETLIEESLKREAVEEARKSQLALDEWYGTKLFHHTPEKDANRRKPQPISVTDELPEGAEDWPGIHSQRSEFMPAPELTGVEASLSLRLMLEGEEESGN